METQLLTCSLTLFGQGTYRYPGWCETLKAIADLKLTSDEERSTKDKSYKQFFCEYLGIDAALSVADIRSALAETLNIDADGRALSNLEWLGLFSSERIASSSAADRQGVIDVVCGLCLEKLAYAEGEKDMLMLKHSFEVVYADGWRASLESVLLDFGQQQQQQAGGASSMARTVSLPLAVAIRALSEGRLPASLHGRGVVRPVAPALYALILDELADLDIGLAERTLAPLLWLRDEVKRGERRVAVTPSNARKLIAGGFRVAVERSEARCFGDAEYAAAGCRLVASGSWRRRAPRSALICGLKELGDVHALRRRHIMFAHCFKGQSGAAQLLRAFARGKGELLDLEFLVDADGRRVAAFGGAAGCVGMALALMMWARQRLDKTKGEPMGAVSAWRSEEAMRGECLALLERVGARPKVLIIGALGRCGRGAAAMARSCGVGAAELSEWDLAETAKGGPFAEAVHGHDVLVNCIRLQTQSEVAPFIDAELCRSPRRRLTVIADVACDPNSARNPVAVYDAITTLAQPVRRITEADEAKGVAPLDVMAIDHLPALIPVEASTHFSDDLLDTLLELKDRKSPVWQRARKVFLEHVDKVRV